MGEGEKEKGKEQIGRRGNVNRREGWTCGMRKRRGRGVESRKEERKKQGDCIEGRGKGKGGEEEGKRLQGMERGTEVRKG